MSFSIFDKYTCLVTGEIQRLHLALQKIGIYLVLGNQGYSVKVIGRGATISLEDAVSLYNKGVESYAAGSLLVWQCEALSEIAAFRSAPITLQRYKGILITEKCREGEGAALVDELVRQRREALKL